MSITTETRDTALAHRVGHAINGLSEESMYVGTISTPVLGTPSSAAPAAVATWKLGAAAAGGAASVVGAYVAGRWTGRW